VATVPAGATNGNVTVTPPGGTTAGICFMATAVTSLSPVTAPAGALLPITGTGLTGATKVTFAESPHAPGTGVASTGIAVNAAGTQLTVLIPDGAKSGNVTVPG
jgi:hypothetical protein